MRTLQRNWAALAVALVLFLHTGIAGFVVGAMASPIYDSFGNVICSSHGDDRTPGKPGPHHLPECCIFGCSIVSAHAMAMAAPELPPLPTGALLDLTPPTYNVPARRLERTPLNPRAPPFLA